MNISISLDGDFELDPTTNNLKLAKDTEEIRQIILRDLETLAGEWFLDTSIGVPWFTEILQKNVSTNKIDAVIIEKISTANGVVSLLSYESSVDRANRAYSIAFTAETVFGILVFDESLAI